MNNEILQKLNENLDNKVQINIPLKEYTTFKIGGPAQYLIEVESTELLARAYKLANELKINCTILGGGSNVLIADEGIKGLVIINRARELKIEDEIVEVSSGYNLTKLVKETSQAGLSGLEFSAGIYGTVGGAVAGNAGAYGSDISHVVTEIEVIEPDGTQKKLKNEPARDASQSVAGGDLKFSYRSSIFKEGYKALILTVWFKLIKEEPEKITKIVQQRLEERMKKGQEDYPSAGCAFRNVPFAEVDLDELKNKGLDIDKFKEIKKIPIGYLVESLDLKGKKIGGAMVSEHHGNFIFNVDNATAQDVITLISFIKQQIRDNYGIQLKEEIQFLGF